jgi:NagD protein
MARDGSVISGAIDFINRLRGTQCPFMLLINNSCFTPCDHQARLRAIGLGIPAQHIFTSALATARFLQKPRQESTACVIGESGITTAIHKIGYIPTAHAEEAVMIGDRMDTDMVAGIESGLGTILVLTDVTTCDMV